ncbi:MAG: hypothetical protein AAF512_11805, partial [Pseudomonadota bacterium]
MEQSKHAPQLTVATIFALFILTIASHGQTNAKEDKQNQPMEKLSWLLGKWTFEDAQVNGKYWEK